MKALTLWEPWASLMARPLKNIETRCWATKYRGAIAIHAAKSRPKHLGLSCESPAFIAKVNQLLPGHTFALGCVLAIRSLVDIVPTEEAREYISDQERLFGNYEDGRYAWIFDTKILTFAKPIAVAGNRLLWDWKISDAAIAAIEPAELAVPA